MSWFEHLDKQRGSRPRCVLLMDGSREKVSRRLTMIVNLPEVNVDSTDRWMPLGKPIKNSVGWDTSPSREAILCQPNDLVSPEVRAELESWWLEVPRRANAPNWDIASTCSIRGQAGLLLVEAKAHGKELTSAGKKRPRTSNGARNHERIGRAIDEASAQLRRVTGQRWELSRDRHYQLSNRFAWSWKLASLGVPVVLLYLGFLNAREMARDGPLLESAADWRRLLKDHSSSAVDAECWEECIDTGGTSFIAVIRAIDQPFEAGDWLQHNQP